MIDMAEGNFEVAVKGVDFVLLVAFIGVIEVLFWKMVLVFNGCIIVIDVGSVKGNVIVAVKIVFGEVFFWLILGYFIVGLECSGVGVVKLDLYCDYRVILMFVFGVD